MNAFPKGTIEFIKYQLEAQPEGKSRNVERCRVMCAQTPEWNSACFEVTLGHAGIATVVYRPIVGMHRAAWRLRTFRSHLLPLCTRLP